ncbi:MAG: methionyl-tRNA formyltransferase [Rhodospirillales bacterium]|nr:methionyl-tRNA formyltransferase [Rhodospirillales bacterium]
MTDNRLRIAFMGTPDFSVPALEALIDSDHEVVCVYTQPPRPKGRGHQVQPSPVHQVAAEHGIPVYTPRSLKKDEAAQEEFAAHDLDVAVVAAYGLLLPKAVLDAPKYGCLNIHASLLPRWRGAAPIQYAIWDGDTESGITIMQMEEGLDTGPMVEKRSVKIRPITTAQSLHDELSALGAAMIVDVLDELSAKGRLDSELQDDELSTYAPMLTKDDGRVDWTLDAAAIDRQIRALTPWPGVWTETMLGKRIKILEAEPVSERYTEPPGTLADRGGHVVCGNDTVLRLTRIQPESAKAMDVTAAVNGGYVHVDEAFA